MKTKLIVTILFLSIIAHAHDIGPEQTLRSIIASSDLYEPGSSELIDSRVDFEAIQKFDPALTKDQFYELLKTVEREKIEFIQIKEPPFSTVVEMTQPKRIRFYLKKQRSSRPSPHDPKYHEEWDYILIRLKTMKSNQELEPTSLDADS